MLLLIRYRFNLSAEDGVILSTYLTPEVKDTAEQGWDEMVDASLTHLLRTTLAKSGKDAATQAMSGSALTMPADTTKLKKHITLVCDRLSKGESRRILRLPPDWHYPSCVFAHQTYFLLLCSLQA